jgi:KDO2-lipid IV(A) lauroyltransferase
MDIQTIINSRYSVSLALRIGRLLPPSVGHRLADAVGGWLGSLRQTSIVQTVEANQRVIGGEGLSREELARRTRATFRQTGRCLYDLYHTAERPDAILEQVRFSVGFDRCVEQICSGRQGTLLVCPHLSNFDLAGRAIAFRGIHLLVLSYPGPPGGYRTQNRLRSVAGLDMAPMSIEALRRATDVLNAGGAVLTGVDRPIADSKYRPSFFGQPVSLPVFHVRLALKLGLPITVVACQAQPDGNYQILASDPIPMQPNPDLVTETVRNAEAVLRVIQEWIRLTPEQWAMFYPVWPEINGQRQGEQ